MTNSCCGNSDSNQESSSSVNPSTTQQVDETAKCETVVNETVCIQADVTITPDVKAGPVQSFCVDNPMIGACPGMKSPTGTCTFQVSQKICVQIPITFAATATAVPGGIVCGTPDIGECPSPGCTLTIGFFKNHPEVTNALIAATPSGSIVLGIDNMGTSFTVTTANANDVLSFNTPSPPAPSLPPFSHQYQVLYAQLLGANLNVLNGATCQTALDLINQANTFLATSPAGGKPDVDDLQGKLADFNEGQTPGCPTHC
jgi:hypothetical protein